MRIAVAAMLLFGLWFAQDIQLTDPPQGGDIVYSLDDGGDADDETLLPVSAVGASLPEPLLQVYPRGAVSPVHTICFSPPYRPPTQSA